MHNNTTAHDILADLATKLDKSKRTGDTLTARCPAHDDKNPSLSVKLGGRGDCVLVHCFTGCRPMRSSRRSGDDARPVCVG